MNCAGKTGLAEDTGSRTDCCGTDKAEIRPLRKEDIPAAAALEKKYFTCPWSENSLRESMDNPNASFLGAYEGRSLLGYGGIYVVCGEGEITDIVVEESFRKKGIGERLTRGLTEKAFREGAQKVFLEVRKSNDAALGCYEKCGYQCVGVRKNFYEKPMEDAVVMCIEAPAHLDRSF